MKCKNCGELNKDKAKFCASCGEKLEPKKIFCTECGKELESESLFCASCGTKITNKTNTEEEKTPWDFDSKLITITFLICSVITTILLASQIFRTLPFIGDNTLMGLLAIILGSILIFLNLKKEKFAKDREIKRIKELKITQFQVGLVFVSAGLIIMLFKLDLFNHSDSFLALGLILLCSFFIMISLIIALNGSKLKLLGEVFTLGVSIVLFILSGYLYTEGNRLNSDTMSRVENFFEHGNANPGTDYINTSIYTLIGAIIFLVLFFIIKSYKGKKTNQ